MKKKKVYISSAYSKGNHEENVINQIIAAEELIKLSFIPFIPLLMHYHHILFSKSYDEWMILTTSWIESCNCLLRLPGESKGADEEVRMAEDLGIPVFYNIKELMDYYQ